MASPPHQNLRTIRFEGELLPNWAQLLDLASRLCSVPKGTRQWFSKLTNSNGVDDAGTVMKHCELLRAELRPRRERMAFELARLQRGPQSVQIFDAWIYALDTMIQQAGVRQTCSWVVEGMEREGDDDSGDGGEIELRRL